MVDCGVVAPQNSGVPIRKIRFSYDGAGEIILMKSEIKGRN